MEAARRIPRARLHDLTERRIHHIVWKDPHLTRETLEARLQAISRAGGDQELYLELLDRKIRDWLRQHSGPRKEIP